jgi:CCDC81 eukaryotic HU domain 2
VFIVGKDFVSAVYIKSGMAHNKGAQVRPFDNKGVCGIVPKVKINYTEVAALCLLNKDICKQGCEQVFRFLSDKARKGESITMEIPFVGVFIIKNGIAAIAFADEVLEDTKGVTAKNHFVNKLFSSSVNKHNL